LQTWLDQRGWNQAELARRTNVTTSYVSLVFRGKRNPSGKFLIAIARALGMPPDSALRAAGLMPPDLTPNTLVRQITHLVSNLPPEEQRTVLEFVEVRVLIADRRARHLRKIRARRKNAASR
jgi:transcriptional regulator with XRE-family HTH domain